MANAPDRWQALREMFGPEKAHLIGSVASLLAAHDALAAENRAANAVICALLLEAGGTIRVRYRTLVETDGNYLIEKTEDAATKDIIFCLARVRE